MDKIKAMIQQFLAEEDGATMIEYGLLAALIALVVAAAVASIGTAMKGKFDAIDNCVQDPNAAGACP